MENQMKFIDEKCYIKVKFTKVNNYSGYIKECLYQEILKYLGTKGHDVCKLYSNDLKTYECENIYRESMLAHTHLSEHAK